MPPVLDVDAKVVDIDPSAVADMVVSIGMDTSDMTICGDSEVPRQAISEFCGCEDVRGERVVRCDCDWPFNLDIVNGQDAAEGVLIFDNENDTNEEVVDGMTFNSIVCNQMFKDGVVDTGLQREGQLRGTVVGGEDVSPPPPPPLASKSSKAKRGDSF